MTRTDCLPWWHTRFAHLTGYKRPKIKSGCRIVSGNVNCRPEDMRARAEAEMRRLGYWRKPMSLAVYTLARYVSSEVGNKGTPEEKVAVIEAAINRARGTNTVRGYYADDSAADGVVKLLLYRQRPGHPNRGWYGPIHGSGGVSTAPYGRWAATSSDPGIDDILIADFVLSGETNLNFSRGAVTQVGAEYLPNLASRMKAKASEGSYWVGPLPGVDHWHTFLIKQDKSIKPDSPLGQQLIAREVAALADKRRPDWSRLRVCKQNLFARIPGPVYAVAGVGAALGIWYLLSRMRRIPEPYMLP